MLNTKGLKLEVRLSAYMDGEVSDAERKEIEQLIARDDEARRLLERLKAGNGFGAVAFETFLHDPVPLSLVREIKQGRSVSPKKKRISKPADKPARPRMWPRAAAASIALLMIGGSTGYLIGKTGNDNLQPQRLAVPRNWLDDIAAYHRIYSRQQSHLVEMPASDSQSLQDWLTSSVGVAFRLPDLTGAGLAFEGGRMLVAAGKPVGQLIYRSKDGAIFAICFMKSAAGDTDGVKTESMRDDLAMISWQRSDATYVVVGPSADANLEELADTVSANI